MPSAKDIINLMIKNPRTDKYVIAIVIKFYYLLGELTNEDVQNFHYEIGCFDDKTVYELFNATLSLVEKEFAIDSFLANDLIEFFFNKNELTESEVLNLKTTLGV